MNRNERKVTVLEHLTNGWDTAEHLHSLYNDRSQTGIFSIRMALLRYYRQGLLRRRRTGNHREYEYKISERGRERLEWLLENSEKRHKED